MTLPLIKMICCRTLSLIRTGHGIGCCETVVLAFQHMKRICMNMGNRSTYPVLLLLYTYRLRALQMLGLTAFAEINHMPQVKIARNLSTSHRE